MKRLEIDQRCPCASCHSAYSETSTRNATCARNGCLVSVMNWDGAHPLNVSTCPGCGHRVELVYDRQASAKTPEPANA